MARRQHHLQTRLVLARNHAVPHEFAEGDGEILLRFEMDNPIPLIGLNGWNLQEFRQHRVPRPHQHTGTATAQPCAQLRQGRLRALHPLVAGPRGRRKRFHLMPVQPQPAALLAEYPQGGAAGAAI